MVEGSRIDSTRRRLIKAGAGIAAGGVLAGCSGRSDDGTSVPDVAGTAGRTGTEAAGDETTYSVTMAPVGTVTFDSVPERWVSYFSTYGDMGIALGRADDLVGMYFTANYPTQFYDELGLDVDIGDVPQMNADNVDKEVFYELGADVHLIDPNMLINWFDWQPSDVDEIARNVGPFVGNMIRRRGDEWHSYRYYTLYEAFEKIAAVFDERERYEAFVEVHDPLIADVRSRLPAEDDRPEIGLLSVNSDFEKGSFWAYPIGEAAGKKQYRDLGVRDAFSSFDLGGAFKLDYEALLEVDPDALVFHFGVSHSTEAEFQRKMDLMREDPVGSKLAAVRNDRLYRGGTPYQGPIINLFQTELAARQLYPDAFGGERLFDRERVAAIVDGEF
jgi:iron complex transport system substrate-binding protein